jgi:preprotein translocase subunit SecD
MFFSSSMNSSQAPLNRFSKWVYGLILLSVVLAVIYALPMLYGDSPSVQLTPKENGTFSSTTVHDFEAALAPAGVKPLSVVLSPYALEFKFKDTEDQLKAYDVFSADYAKQAVIALNLSPNTPNWFHWFGASPMKLGLDLRGGMYFLLDVDTPAVLDSNLQNYAEQLRENLRTQNIRYAGVDVHDGVITLRFRSSGVRDQARSYIQSHFLELQESALSTDSDSDSNSNSNTDKNADIKANLTPNSSSDSGSGSGPQNSKDKNTIDTSKNFNQFFVLKVKMTPQAQTQVQSYAVGQTVNVMRNRVNELGVAEASVAQQGINRVVIELPGLQDAARAKEIIGGTSTLKVMLVNESADIQDALAGHVPSGSTLYYGDQNRPVVLFDPVVLTGNSVVGATAGFDSQTSQPIVSVTLSGSDVSRFSDATAANVGHLMAIVLVDQSFSRENVNGKVITHTQETDKVISVANILQRLDNHFQITGLSQRESQSLAMSIRAGALPAPVQIVEEKHIGPSLGAENIKMGAISVAVAMLLVMVFIGFYYHLFGLIADIALILNLIFIIAIMSILPGATLTLPGIAGIVLNVGMAIDANVLIFERIREELRNGTTVQVAIYTGYQRAFATIVDSNVTTLIVAIILFAVGSGAVKGFSVTLMIGIVTSMFTALIVTRAFVNLIYGSKPVKWISIGIRNEIKKKG